jgi:hypothetical protein
MVALSKSLMIWWNFMVLPQLVVCCESAAIQQPAIPDIPRSSNLDTFPFCLHHTIWLLIS